MKGKLALVVMIAVVVVCGIGIGGAKAQSSSALAGTTAGPKKAEEQYKNIQVLKGIPADQLIPAMQFIATSLGVGCEFCHVEGAFDKDDKKPKVTARKMMAMMFAINKDNFEGNREVTCYSCHRGSSMPVGTPVIMAEEGQPAAEAKHEEEKSEGEEGKQASGPTADQLFDKYLQAAGGAAAVDKIMSRVMK